MREVYILKGWYFNLSRNTEHFEQFTDMQNKFCCKLNPVCRHWQNISLVSWVMWERFTCSSEIQKNWSHESDQWQHVRRLGKLQLVLLHEIQ